MAFVYNNDVYYKESARSETIRITTTGLNRVVFNGHTDWLYEEEILNSNKALWFSPNGASLAYLEINDTLVEVVSWNRYGEYYNISNNQYPVMETIRYSKPGTPIPKVSLFVAKLHSAVDQIRIQRVSPPMEMAGHE